MNTLMKSSMLAQLAGMANQTAQELIEAVVLFLSAFGFQFPNESKGAHLCSFTNSNNGQKLLFQLLFADDVTEDAIRHFAVSCGSYHPVVILPPTRKVDKELRRYASKIGVEIFDAAEYSLLRNIISTDRENMVSRDGILGIILAKLQDNAAYFAQLNSVPYFPHDLFSRKKMKCELLDVEDACSLMCDELKANDCDYNYVVRNMLFAVLAYERTFREFVEEL